MTHFFEGYNFSNYFQFENFINVKKNSPATRKIDIFKKIKKGEKDCFARKGEPSKHKNFEKSNRTKNKTGNKKIFYTLNDINSLNFINYAKENCSLKADEEIRNFSSPSNSKTTCLESIQDYFSPFSNETTKNFRNVKKINQEVRILPSLNDEKEAIKIQKTRFKIHSNLSKSEITEKKTLYFIEPNYLQNKYLNSELNASMRAILVDWMIEVCHDYNLKRDTLYEAVNILDRFLTKKTKLISKENLQLIGAICLFISSKKEEIQPLKIENLIALCANSFSKKDIEEMEFNILQELKWLINPLTLNSWLNHYLYEWECFLSQNMDIAFNKNQVYFFNDSPDCFINYRFITSLLDVLLLQIKTQEYSIENIILSLIFIATGFSLGEFDILSIQKIKDLKLGRRNTHFNVTFNKYCRETTICSNLFELEETLEYIANFAGIKINFQLPQISKQLNKNNYYDMITCQFHNEGALAYLQTNIST